MYDPYGQPQLFDDTSSSGNYGYHDGEYDNNLYGQNLYRNQNTNQRGQPATMNAQGSGYSSVPGTQFIQDPLVANMAMQYGQDLMGQGQTIVKEKLEKFVSVNKIKYYFAVDTNYVIKKLKLLFFPFLHSEWNIRYEEDEPVQPRHDLNAPDLYIPLMGFVTYILAVGLCLGLQDRFSPDILGVYASWAVVWLFLEMALIIAFLHLTNLHTRLHYFHLLALSSYKYTGMIVSLFGSIMFSNFGYYCVLPYSSLSLVIFMFRTLRGLIQEGSSSSIEGYSTGTKRRFYLLLLISGIQPFMMWWLTRSLLVTSSSNLFGDYSSS